MAPNALPRTDELVDPRIPNTLSADASPGAAGERTVPSSPATARLGSWAWAGPPWRSISTAATDLARGVVAPSGSASR
jgi:hypothetical protein